MELEKEIQSTRAESSAKSKKSKSARRRQRRKMVHKQIAEGAENRDAKSTASVENQTAPTPMGRNIPEVKAQMANGNGGAVPPAPAGKKKKRKKKNRKVKKLEASDEAGDVLDSKAADETEKPAQVPAPKPNGIKKDSQSPFTSKLAKNNVTDPAPPVTRSTAQVIKSKTPVKSQITGKTVEVESTLSVDKRAIYEDNEEKSDDKCECNACIIS
jgi:hypothetical protein